MVRIVGVQKDRSPEREFVLLQNQGSVRLNLRGHMLASNLALLSGDLGDAFHSFSEDVMIGPGQFVVLYSGIGTGRWLKAKDGSLIYHGYMGRDKAVWNDALMPLHVLNVQHSYCERAEPSLLMR